MGELPEAALSVARGFELGSPPSFATIGFAASAKAFTAGTVLAAPLGASFTTAGVSLAAEASLPFAVVSTVAATCAAVSIVAATCAAPSFAGGDVSVEGFNASGATSATGPVPPAVAAISVAAFAPSPAAAAFPPPSAFGASKEGEMGGEIATTVPVIGTFCAGSGTTAVCAASLTLSPLAGCFEPFPEFFFSAVASPIFEASSPEGLPEALPLPESSFGWAELAPSGRAFVLLGGGEESPPADGPASGAGLSGGFAASSSINEKESPPLSLRSGAGAGGRSGELMLATLCTENSLNKTDGSGSFRAKRGPHRPMAKPKQIKDLERDPEPATRQNRHARQDLPSWALPRRNALL